MRVYVSGPMTGRPDWNYPAFALAASAWRAAGHDALNPAETFGGDTSRTYAEYMRADVEMLLTADAIALLPGWEGSRGARFELLVAQMLGLPVHDATTQAPLAVPPVATLVGAAS